MKKKYTVRTDEQKQKLVGAVDKLVNDGWSIDEACKRAKVGSTQYYDWKRVAKSAVIVHGEDTPKVKKRRYKAARCVVVVTDTENLSSVLETLQ